MKYFHENIIKYATFSDVKQNASQNSADFGGQDLPVKNILIRDYTIWPHFWEKYEGWKIMEFINKSHYKPTFDRILGKPKMLWKTMKNIWHNGK